MKKLILSLLMITMLTGCVSEPVKQEEVMTAEVTTQAETIGNIDLDEEKRLNQYLCEQINV